MMPKLNRVYFLVQDIPRFCIFWGYWACFKVCKGPLDTLNKIFRISMSSTKVYLANSSYLRLKIAHFHWIYQVIPDFTHFLAFWVYLGAPRGPLVFFRAP